MNWLGRFGIGLGFAALVAAGAYTRRSLTFDGALAATVLGGSVYASGGLPAAATLVGGFFLPSSLLSHWKKSAKARRGVLAQAKGGQRDAQQVLANGGVAAISILLGSQSAFVGALATASGDTWATELGLLSPTAPRNLFTGREVQPGTSGGITPLGLVASVVGGGWVGFAWWLGARNAGFARSVGREALVGLVGSFADSLLGATLQASYHCPACGEASEARIHRCGARCDRNGGVAWMDNDAVNLLATLIGATAAYALH